MYKHKSTFFNHYTVFSLIVYLSSFRAPDASEEALTYSVPGVIQKVQTLSLAIIAVLMLLSLFCFGRTRKSKGVNRNVMYFFTFQCIVIVTTYFYNKDLNDLILRLTFLLLIAVYFLQVIRKLDFCSTGDSLLKSFFLGVFFFVVTNVVIYQFSFGVVVWNGRLFGVTSHPNFLGMAGSVTTFLGLFFFLTVKKWRERILYLSAICIGVYTCILTGSRTGVGSAIIAVVVYIFVSTKSLTLKVFIGLLGTLTALFLLQYLEANHVSMIELVDYEGRGNTRNDTWGELLNIALTFPLFGTGRGGATSNSFLYSIAAAGIVGAIFLYMAIARVANVYFSSAWHFTTIEARNVYAGLAVLILAAALFEGFLLDISSVAVFLFWLLLVIPRKKRCSA